MPNYLVRAVVDFDFEGEPNPRTFDLGDVSEHTIETLVAKLEACSKEAPDQWIVAALRDEMFCDMLVTATQGSAQLFNILHFDAAGRDLLERDVSPWVAWDTAKPLPSFRTELARRPDGSFRFPFEFANEAELADFVRSVAAGRDVAALKTLRAQVATDAGTRFVVVFDGNASDVTPAITRTFFGNEEIDDRLHLWRSLWPR